MQRRIAVTVLLVLFAFGAGAQEPSTRDRPLNWRSIVKKIIKKIVPTDEIITGIKP